MEAHVSGSVKQSVHRVCPSRIPDDLYVDHHHPLLELIIDIFKDLFNRNVQITTALDLPCLR